MVYVKHKEYNKYGCIDGSLFTQHRFINVNQEQYGSDKKPNCLKIGEFIHYEPKYIDDNFYNDFEIIDIKSYSKCIMIDSNNIDKVYNEIANKKIKLKK